MGEEVEQDFSKSRKWYSEAAKQGNFEASYNLGTMYLDGQGGEVNKPEGLKLLELAATAKKYDLGALAAAKLLIDIYKNGCFGVEVSTSKTAKYEKVYINQNNLFDDYLNNEN